ncbi:lytic transglycosylase domain-containing protein [Phaeobacter piscinae]|uniref:lytic transglycosylase domain-containing protein n=1 Tax=Phaeobacter piscinae TaxID=1580596 RepID=UPI000BBE1DBD|nr:lytic transglycosylase domain-containing protein [Phaeobacter piscinae]ATG38669.1 Soluble lytic murein transglycosylase [Phaeobacter piscinae]
MSLWRSISGRLAAFTSASRRKPPSVGCAGGHVDCWSRRVAAALAASAVISTTSADESGAQTVEKAAPAPFPKFEAKRVRPPKPGTKQRIKIQIETPANIPAPPAATEAVAPAAPHKGRYTGFWAEISDSLADGGPGRLAKALRALDGDTPVAAPRLQLMQEIATARGVQILTASVGTDVSPALVLAVIAVESAGKAEAVSSAGAQGLMQLMPDTAARFGVSNALDSGENIAGGVKYLNWLMGEFNRDPVLVLAGYNAGEGSVRSHAGVPPFAETRDYVPKVLAAFQVARSLCMTPPELITDGCVFRRVK